MAPPRSLPSLRDGDDRQLVGGQDRDVGETVPASKAGRSVMNGNDCIVGGAANDWLQGDSGTDVCIGGPGTDTFHSSCETQIQ